ncbi:MAG: phosphoribosyltransferase family protein [Candidatus Omnitrophota bacterium]
MGTLNILSNSDAAFIDRKEAGILLAEKLERFQGEETVVLGILRGGIIVAREIAVALNADIDIILSRKIGAPLNPELAIGAVSEDGAMVINEEIAADTGADALYINEEKERQMTEIRRRGDIFRKVKPKVSLKEKIVIITDDGIATGATMQTTIWAVRNEKPKKIILAIPVAPQKTVEKLSRDADEVICLKAPCYFGSVSNFFIRFEQIPDETVLETLKEINELRDGTSGKT